MMRVVRTGHWRAWLLFLMGVWGAIPAARAQPQITLDTVLVAVDPTAFPFTAQAPNGQIVGFDIDLMDSLARTIGLKILYEPAPFANLIPGVATQLYDVALACIFITDERAEFVNFSEVYYTTGIVLVTHQNNNRIQSIEDLTPEVAVSVGQGTTAEEYVRQQTKAHIITSLSLEQALKDVANANTAATMIDEMEALTFIRKHPQVKLKIVGGLLTTDRCAIAVNKERTDLLIKLNTALVRMQNNGKLAALQRQWFGNTPALNIEPTPVPQPTLNNVQMPTYQ